ncbi:MAG TPA: PLDc N-terminal domain-containing protein [Verrucomicrobiae bacterium]|nr:PLDc N-terminal domain-containing protein [Verrucomicrobiae bacterium]
MLALAGLFAGAFGLLFVVGGIVLAVLACIFWIWMLVHAITNRGLTTGEKIIWVLVIIFLHFLGAFLYFLLGRPRGRAAVA